ncbi:hypothetical protein AVEN_137449-1 [Araneus ventricosus]|uniref:Uncharacterized protein n=1 Tax=Araneus ventricosus TaxID=182803 RepID=A0A4Y2K0V1_ARAVE|nr:hypothetical protein AVEN_137449-1 [Araneus ventricosus]
MLANRTSATRMIDPEVIGHQEVSLCATGADDPTGRLAFKGRLELEVDDCSPNKPCEDSELSGPFTTVPNWNFWKTGKKNLSLTTKTYETWSKWTRGGGIQKNSKSETPSADSNLGPLCEASGKAIVLPRLGLDEAGREQWFCLDWDLTMKLKGEEHKFCLYRPWMRLVRAVVPTLVWKI